MNPACCGHFGDQVLRVLNVVLQDGDHRSVLLREELLGHRTAFLTHTDLLRMKQKALHITRGITTLHVRDREERTRLGADLAAVVLKGNLVTKNGVGIDRRIIVAVSFARVHEQLVNCRWIDAGGLRYQIGSLVTTRADRLGIKGLNSTKVVSGVS